MFLFSERILYNSEEFCENSMFDICQCSNLPVICKPFVTSLKKKKKKIFADRSIALFTVSVSHLHYNII